MKVSRRVTALALVVLLALVGLELYLQSSDSSSGTGPWTATTSYPLQANGVPGVAGQSCVGSNGSVYCIGGQDSYGDPRNQVYSASISSSGVGNWTDGTNPYPQDVMFQSCAAYSGYLYCVGGVYDSTSDDVAFAYYAPLTSSGLGLWKPTTNYPVPVDTESCVTSSGYLYCIGGENQTSGTNATDVPSNSAWYAPVSGSGIGNWTLTTAYPQGLYLADCTAVGGYAYCVGGESFSGQAQNGAYYAPLSAEGIGSWTKTTAYPIDAAGQACIISSTELYCVAGWTGGSSYTGAVYYAEITPGGIGSWQAASDYPLAVLTSCVGSSGYIYCIGGTEGGSGPTTSVYYGLLVSASSSGTISST